MSTNISNPNLTNSTGHINILLVSIYSFISFFGLIFNLIALFIFYHNKFRSQTVVYMTNLATADVLLILTLPMRIYYYLGFDNLPQWLCEVLGLVLKANMYGSIFLLTSICLDRCMAVTFPMSSRVQEWRKKAPLVCLGIWLLTFGASVPIYLSKRSQVKNKDCFDGLPVYATNLVVVLPTLIVGFGIPLIIMLICSWGLARAVRRSTATQTGQVDEKKIKRMIITSLFIFILSFLPYHVILVLFSLVDVDSIPQPMKAAYSYSLMVACFNTVLDPVAYYFTTDTFRKSVDMGAVWRMFPLSSQSPGTERRIHNS
ncbi:lysophosphatidic acid receptor 6 [Pungitius pungitius]|uniref:lysophosphatidic acid receptor 6 n=1 Tax=Pungitius pungitius TaxID=134920 RepID=UPI00188926CF|nr:lysophosphatidic acid receptor 6 [Pungitius pungitius]